VDDEILVGSFHPSPEEEFRANHSNASVHNAEYYQPMIATAVVNGKPMYFIRETHGWFNDAEKRPVSVTETLFHQEGLESHAEAAKLFEQQLQHRISEGFAHSFGIDPYTGVVYEYLGK